eukprot:Gregarina_sp_Poly_1__6389@NODE_3405_length_1119_cov_204_596008_g2153_i0_p3_GENE_NODE_3405_length_1119_cov_204_596008_g2153_i0NODE_3405_length_1119_cov_204_596008_g2153_i0_p3_ORF_typecomplete_len103_score9_99_NODE_3405_length_1119_cov_204_596008_g2153_i0390698
MHAHKLMPDFESIDRAVVASFRKSRKTAFKTKGSSPGRKPLGLHFPKTSSHQQAITLANSNLVLSSLRYHDIVAIMTQCSRNPLLFDVCCLSGWLQRFSLAT